MQTLSRSCAVLLRDVGELKAEFATLRNQPVAASARSLEEAGISRTEVMSIANTASKVNGATLKTECLTSAKAEALTATRALIRSECPAIAKAAAESMLAAQSSELAAVRRMVEQQQAVIADLLADAGKPSGELAAVRRMVEEQQALITELQAAKATAESTASAQMDELAAVRRMVQEAATSELQGAVGDSKVKAKAPIKRRGKAYAEEEAVVV